MFIDGELRKAITVTRLLELLATIPADSLISVNSVGNLLIRAPDKSGIGFINLAEDAVEMFDKE